jgi:hypothetical protein
MIIDLLAREKADKSRALQRREESDAAAITVI